VVDLGTGDGRYVLAVAAADPAALVLGLDASRDGLVEAAVRAARPSTRGGLANARFVVAAAPAPASPSLLGSLG
jgi:tRNA G46 methylase TrmB